MRETGYEEESQDIFSTAYGLAKKIQEDIESMELEEEFAAITLDVETEGNNTEVQYLIESTDVYQELGYEPETSELEKSGRIEPANGIGAADEDIMAQAMEEAVESALKVNGDVVRELTSPDYDAFQ